MRLFLPVLLVTLALYCCEVSAGTICPAIPIEIGAMFLAPKPMFARILRLFDPSEEVFEAEMKAKDAIDVLTTKEKLLCMKIVGRLLKECVKN
ncbi:uteroglobin-like [Erinaceus europaeus]|uniref:Uteroglobin-like n=1 Tax=Erinaceus europaeus TaxID=9365 RepID=A0ABM3W6U7_ERIEU|nr:uteroglobin-like [Erinaceus europaeus]XP_060033439.1 uteroglobin-like [Erinaceus europaeus]